jgi:cation transport regulator ChaC
MAAGNAFSRREALSLFGLAGGAAAASAAAGAPSEAAAAAARRQYVFGYGSLIERESRIATWPSATGAAPVFVRGIARGWFDQTDVPSWNPTYLGAVAKPGALCNGVIFAVSPAELAAFAERETGYRPTRIARSQVTMLDGNPAPAGDIWYFANTQKRFASDEHPIVQSYVDVCLDGCLEIEATYPLAQATGFAKRFITTTSHWGPPWVNDRIYPWRPFVYVPRAFAIDALIREVLGEAVFARITLR